MSRTVAVDVVGPEYWSYMAVVMAEHVGRMATSHHIDPATLPKGVYADAKRFFRLVLQEVADRPPQNPPASINAYVIAADAAKGSGAFPIPQEHFKQLLEKYWALIEDLETPRELTEQDVQTAEGLHRFFLRLHEAGETKAYERRR
jgi:hypothetical protein